jgi:hypothetical protein
MTKLFRDFKRTDPSPRRPGPTDGPLFTSGKRLTVDFLRSGDYTTEKLARLVELPVGKFLRELRAWCETGDGFTYGISVTRDGEIRCAR